jgi:alkanesulfonate monooxygenase SsuD/methylene tetrahydromethanopterin reductase-like flavin-dependent oxidoreductase (luciferase family)
MFTLRFDMRVPHWAGSPGAHYAAALDICAWAETRGAVLAVLSEHHGAEDRHRPSPLILASAIAGRTSRLTILLAAVPIPFWDPVRLAEEITVLDQISGGRVVYVFGIGHLRQEYLHFGVDMSRRGELADELLDVVRRLVAGEVVSYQGREVAVTPGPVTATGPTMMIAGGSRAAARRAARHGLGLIAQTDSPGLADYYAEQCALHGHQPGLLQLPITGAPTVVFVAEDLDAAWAELGLHLLHDAVTAASYRPGDDSVASITRATTVDALRAENGPYRVLTPAEAAEYVAAGRPLPLHPLCGGLAPDAAWRYLQAAVAAIG